MRKSIIGMAIAVAGAAAIGAPATVGVAKSDPDVLYKSTISPVPDNLPSLGYEATQTTEFGNQIVLTKAASPLSTVVVTMSSWACQSGSATDGTCVTSPGATFSEPITLNIYNANAPGSPTAGSLITSVTKTFKIPYRPSAAASCGTGGGWGASCSHGKANNITFNLASLHVSLPQSIVYGIAYNTSDYGPTPYGDTTACHSAGPGGGDGCPYDSLNVALSNDPTNLNKGSDPNPGKVFWNTLTPANYCDNGTAGTGTFRLDSPGTDPSDQCWSVPPAPAGTAPYYIPAVEFNEG